MSEILIEVENVSKKFCRDLRKSLWYGVRDLTSELLRLNNKGKQNLRAKEFWALRNVDFVVKRGQCLGLIGHNGAGKSTLLKMLNGLIKPDIGRITMKGRVGALIELGAGFNPILTGRENIYVNGSVLGFTSAEIDSKLGTIIDFAEIGEFIDTPVQYYSSGMKVRLGFAVASQMEPDVLIIDEVLAVGDAAFRVKCYNKIFEIIPNTAIVFVSHSMSQVSRVCDHILLLDHGRIIYNGGNMGEGIGEYFKRLDFKESKSIQTSGKAEIVSMTAENGDFEAASSFHYHDKLRLVVRYKILANMPSVSFLFVLRNDEQLPVAQFKSPEIIVNSDLLGSEVLLSTTINRIEFNPGKYTITASIIRGKSEDLLCVCRDICGFLVDGNEVGFAPILMDLKWQST